MRRPRLTLRSLMLAVAIIGLLLAGGLWARDMRRRSDGYHARAILLGRMEKLSLNMVSHEDFVLREVEAELAEAERHPPPPPPSRHLLNRFSRWLLVTDLPSLREKVSRRRQRKILALKQVSYYTALRRKYDRAARYPWFPVTPDPPMPE